VSSRAKRGISSLLLAFLATVTAAQDEAQPVNERMPLTRVAVMVYPTGAAAKNLAGSAQSRLEQILTENSVEVTDRDESKKIKSIWKKLEDPGYFVTADDFVKNAGSYQLDGIVRVYLSADSSPAPGTVVARPPKDLNAEYVALAQLENQHNTAETATCADRAAGGDVGVVGGSLQSLVRGPRGLEKQYGSRVHLVDLAQKRQVTVFDTRLLGRKPREHRGTSKVLDCMFVHSWRYLAAVTGDVLSLWDTERGLNLSEILLPFGTDQASLEVLRAGEAYFLRVRGEGEQQVAYKIAPGKT